jgi:hypothetical protein
MPEDDEYLAAYEADFLDTAVGAAEFGQRSLSLVRETIDGLWDALVRALALAEDELVFSDYWYPEKLWDANPDEAEINIGVRIDAQDLFDLAVYRYWTSEGTGIQACIWMKERPMLDRLSQAIAARSDPAPEPPDAWEFFVQTDGTYYITRVVAEPEFGQIEDLLTEFVSYLIRVLTEIGGIPQFLQ